MIRVRNLTLRAGDFTVSGVDLDVAAGEYFVLLGPNGSGKTLLLNCLCGLLRATAGSIEIGGQVVTDAEPRLRRIGYVPQDYGLFPHLTVAQNVTFALRAHGMSHAEAMVKARPLIEMLGLGRLLDHLPMTLSGGERQKVALARAVALGPRLLALDEPVAALDAPTRTEVLAQLKDVQRRFRVATIHVCHSIGEAAVVADKAGVMVGGRLVQTGLLAELMAKPATPQVARLLAEGGRT